MQVSLITPCFNSEKTIHDTLRSVAEQTYHSIEHILIDGLSTDDTLKIIKTYPSVSRLISEPDMGIYDAMNKGIRIATGDIIGILNSDDFYTDNNVIADVAQLMRTENTDALYADLQFVDASDETKIKRTWIAGAFEPNMFYKGWAAPHPTFFVRRHIYEQYGLFETSLKSAADYELMLRFLFRHRISVTYLPRVIVKMRMGGQSTASFSNRLKANREDRKAWAMNGLKPKFYTLYAKPLLKLRQYFIR
jgi:glycosyltransferase